MSAVGCLLCWPKRGLCGICACPTNAPSTAGCDETAHLRQHLQVDRKVEPCSDARKTPTIDGPLTHETLRAWLVTELARRVKCAESEVDTAKPFDAYGLDSRAAVQVSGALEKVVERRLSPGILFDHETIDDLADYLTRELRLHS